MLSREDTRWRLLPYAGVHNVYLHRRGGDGSEFVSGPQPKEPSAETIVSRIESAADHSDHRRWGPYERRDADSLSSRRDADRRLTRLDAAPCAVDLQTLADRLSRLADGMFSSLICPMERIVFSLAVEDHTVAITRRDAAKGAMRGEDFCLVQETPEGVIGWWSPSGDMPSGSTIPALRFHRRRHVGEILCHAHLTFPVLVDAPYAGVSLIAERPRSAEFGEALHAGLSDQTCLLRRGEGAWCAGQDPARLLMQMREAQRNALSHLRDAMPNSERAKPATSRAAVCGPLIETETR